MLFATLLGVASAVPTPARAEVVNLACPAYSTTTYEPGLTNTPQQVTVTQTGVAGPCSSPSHPDITAGTWKSTGTGTFSCVSGSGKTTRTFRWNTGESSVAEERLTISARPQGQTVNLAEGKVTSGVFAGDTTRDEAVRPNTDLSACQTSEGLTNSTGPRDIKFFGPL